MPRPPKRSLLALAAESTSPPDALTESQSVARVVGAEGSSLYNCALPNGNKTVLVELDPKFRQTVWVRRGGFVVVDLSRLEELRGKGSRVQGDIVAVVRDDKSWRKMPYWPKQFSKSSAYDQDSDEEQSNVGKMPPSDSEDEQEET